MEAARRVNWDEKKRIEARERRREGRSELNSNEGARSFHPRSPLVDLLELTKLPIRTGPIAMIPDMRTTWKRMRILGREGRR